MPRAAGEALYIILMMAEPSNQRQVSATALGSEAADPPVGTEENKLRKYMEWKNRAVKALEEKLHEHGERV